jgi:Rrf2 family protein
MRLMLAVAKLTNGGSPVKLEVAARHCGLSSRYLGQLVPSLKNAQLLQGRTGPGGGYVLGREPQDIRLVDIVEAAIGPIAIIDCAIRPDECIHQEFCTCWGLWALINQRIRQSLEEFTIEDLLADDWRSSIREQLDALA